MTTKCRVCGNEHSGGCAQFFAESSRAPRQLKPDEQRVMRKALKQSVKVVATGRSVPNVPNTAAARRTAAWREANAEKHREYMRGLMRERRAAQKQKQAGT